ncbi:MAG: hypothetical protein ACOC2W_03800 [bacterium]
MSDLLTKIRVLYIQDLIYFFIKKFVDGELKTLDSVIHNIKSASNCIMEMNYMFDDDENIIRIDFTISNNNGKYSILIRFSNIDEYINKLNNRTKLI